jgi:hypothetical protein
MALRTDVGLSWLVAVAMPVLALSIFLVIRKMSPLFRSCRPGSTLSIECCGSRSQGFGWSGHSCVSRTRRRGSPGECRAHRHGHFSRRYVGVDLSDRDVHSSMHPVSRCCGLGRDVSMRVICRSER